VKINFHFRSFNLIGQYIRQKRNLYHNHVPYIIVLKEFFIFLRKYRNLQKLYKFHHGYVYVIIINNLKKKKFHQFFKNKPH